ncbi:SANT/Myb domain [Dillenia turbinata]|uniref:SANT/Myb domain n=1 Tax=Dillenia turbinata TaxID=194707 RepID=A0AAN8Z3B5_9MAGN
MSQKSENSGGEIMLFGVRLSVDPMRKSVSLNNLSQYEQNPNNFNNIAAAADVPAAGSGYVSDDAIQNSSTKTRERKRGVPWTEEEHKRFLLGLQKVGKGDWRGISRNFVKTRTPTQVASHAQKYFLRRSNLNRRRRRSSLFDITSTDSFGIEEKQEAQPIDSSPKQLPFPILDQDGLVCPIQLFPVPAVRDEQWDEKPTTDSSSNLSLNLSLSSMDENKQRQHPAVEGMAITLFPFAVDMTWRIALMLHSFKIYGGAEEIRYWLEDW